MGTYTTKAVLISEEGYRAMVETLCINSIPGIKNSILQASQEPIENFSDTISWDDEVEG